MFKQLANVVVRPLRWFGWRPPVAVTLTWNLAWCLIYVLGACGYAWWSFRTDEHGRRLASLARLDARAKAAWPEIAAAYMRHQPPNLPLPVGDPAPTLDALMADPLVYRAFYIGRDHQMTMRERDPHNWRGRTVHLDLDRWRPTYEPFRSWRGPWAHEWQIERGNRLMRDDFLSPVLRYGLPRGPKGDPVFRTYQRDNWRYTLKGTIQTGLLGYSIGTVQDIDHDIERVLARMGLGGDLVLGTNEPHPPAFQLGGPDPNWALTLWASRTGLARADAAGNREAIPWLVGLGLLGLLRLVAAVLDLRTLVAEHTLALAQSNFVSAVSHEMRTPLTTIRMYAEMLEQDVVTDPARRKHYLQTIAAEGERLGRLVENVLDYARISGRRKAYRFEPVDARELVQEALAAVAGPLERAGLAVELHAPVPVLAEVDRDAIVQSLVNLLGNAIKYGAAGGRVVVSALPAPGGIALAVEDFGPGIPPDEQRHVFKPFYRVGNELTRTATGSGLGLALVEETARAHKGRVELDSAPGRGSTFRLLLPACHANEG